MPPMSGFRLILSKIGVLLGISLGIYLGTALTLALTGRFPGPSVSQSGDVLDNRGLDFSALTNLGYDNLPDLQPFTARDGSLLYYRSYPSRTETKNLLILLHGSGWHSMQFYSLATFLSRNGSADVITPDLRGHGFHPEHRGDVDYIGQLEDDLADLISVLRPGYPDSLLVIGGHSSGGGLAIRFAGGDYGFTADSYLLMAPYIKYNAETTRPNSGGWAHPLTGRIAGLTMLNNLGIKGLNHRPVIRFDFPLEILESELGTSATPVYSYRLNRSFAPRSRFGEDLASITQPFLLIAGSSDQAFVAERYEPLISTYSGSGRYHLIDGVGHIDLLTTGKTHQVLVDWLD